MTQAQELLDTFLSPDEFSLMVSSKERIDFIKNILIPKLKSSQNELQKFNTHKFQYLTENNYPLASNISSAEFTENLKNLPDINSSEALAGSPFCDIPLSLALYGTLVIGAIATMAIVTAIAVIVAPFCGGLSAAFLLLGLVGIAVGVTITVFLIDKLIKQVCG